MVHNPGGDWHPGWGVDLKYINFFHQPWDFSVVSRHFGGPRHQPKASGEAGEAHDARGVGS